MVNLYCPAHDSQLLKDLLSYNSLGQNFATIEAITAATAILRRFKFELLPGQKSPPDFAHTVTLRMKDPLMVKVHIR